MTKLLVQKTNNKFINNIDLSSMDFCSKLVIDTTNELYKIYYHYKFSHAIFIASLFNEEINQFVLEFGEIVKVFIYNDLPTEFVHNKNIHAVIQKNKIESKNKIVVLPKLVNHEIFNQKKSNRVNQIVSFLDDIDVIPENLNKYLYPSSKLCLKLFNNDSIIHPQNLGLVSEQDKASLLQQSDFYLAITDYYVPEAWACGTKVLEIDDLESLEPNKFKNSKSFQSYANFLKVLLSDKK